MYEGALYHVTVSGNGGQVIYRNDTDWRQLFDLLGREVEQQQWRCDDYCLMDNHDHSLLEMLSLVGNRQEFRNNIKSTMTPNCLSH